MRALVAITQNREQIELAIGEALAYIPLESLVRGKVVAVKPNETSAKPGKTTGVTQPDTLHAVLREIKRFGPREIVVTGGSGAGETDQIFRSAGLMQVVEEEGAEFHDHNRPPFVPVQLEYAPQADHRGPQKEVQVNRRVLEYETLVSLAQLKVHATATVTLALKNIAMSYPAADFYGHPRASEQHENAFFDDMHSFIAGMARRFPIQLAIIVGHPAMLGRGPLDGHAVETGLVIASTDAVAADVVGAQILGFHPQAVRYLWELKNLGLGETDTKKIEYPALSLDDAYARFTEAAYGERLKLQAS